MEHADNSKYKKSGGGGQQGRYVKSKLQKTACGTVVESLDVPTKHTLILPTDLILPKDSHG